MTKILFVSGWYPTEDKPSFGIFVRRHAEAAALNNQVSVLYIHTTTSQDEKLFQSKSETKNNLFEVVITINKNKFLFPPISHVLKMSFFFIALIKGYKIIISHSGKPALVHANILFQGGMQALFLKLFYSIPFVCSEHWTGYLPEDGSYKGFFKKLFSRLISSQAEFILPVTKHLASAMQSHGLKGNFRVVPNVVNTTIFHPAGEAARKKNQIVHVSSLDERQKNFRGILNAFKKISNTNSDLKLIVAGGENNIASAEKLVKELALDKQKIIFRGNLNAINLAVLLAESSCLVLFSNFENQPCVILESMACGIPVISSAVGGLLEIINENNGILVEAGNENELVSAIEKMIKNNHKFSSQHLSEFVSNHFSNEKINLLLNEVYKKALSK